MQSSRSSQKRKAKEQKRKQNKKIMKSRLSDYLNSHNTQWIMLLRPPQKKSFEIQIGRTDLKKMNVIILNLLISYNTYTFLVIFNYFMTSLNELYG
jgi:hypothetical protein